MIQRIAFGGLALLALVQPVLAATTFGAGITLQESTPIVDLQENGDGYQGTRVRVEGRVVAIVPDGSWVRVEDTEGNGFWVEAGDWAFAEDTLGLYAVAEGDVGRVIPEGPLSIDGLTENLGVGENVGLSSVGAIVGEIEAIVLDGVQAAGVEPVVPPGSQGEGADEERTPPEGGHTQGP